MHFDGELITALLATWRKLGKNAAFVANESGAYVFDRSNGETLQFVTPAGMKN